MPGDGEESNVVPLWPLTQIDVLGLVGRTKISLPLDPTTTLLTGENGSGKSTILQGVHALATGDWELLGRLPLEALKIAFADGTEIQSVTRDDGLKLSNQFGDIWDVAAALQTGHSGRLRNELRLWRSRRDRARTPDEFKVFQERVDLVRQRLASVDEVEAPEVPAWVTAVAERCHTKLISARRLEHRLRPEPERQGGGRGEPPESVVNLFALELASKMRDELSQYAAESRRQERNLPSQIVEAMLAAQTSNAEELAKDVDNLRSEVRTLADSLARVGLFQEEDPDQQFVEYPRNNPNILLAIREVYRVTLQRLQRLTELRSDLELFASFLNERLSYKRIELNQRSGIDVVLEDDARITPSGLSSGEQQLLALTFELLFQTKPHSIVLLDEPELSLHVAWLQGLLSAFIDIGASRELQSVIATHSPSVVAGHTDRERSLDTAYAS
jgi:energy-coupling factor transporter ATP-binding protein EcfA2